MGLVFASLKHERPSRPPIPNRYSHRMKKAQLLKRIVASLLDSLNVLERAARASHAEATHESSKAENKYDTRGLEASYLARGQSKQAAEAAQAIEEFESLPVRDFAPSEAIDIGAFVELKSKSESAFYFIGPRGG